ncbi:hypothetical protein Dimus_017263 [Dionaea muscipula]
MVSTYEDVPRSSTNRQIQSSSSSSSSSAAASSLQHLHSIQKSTSKHAAVLLNKKPAAPDLQPPVSKQPKVYKVEPIHFRELVQQLTGAPEYQRHPTGTATAPPPLQGVAPLRLQVDGSVRGASSVESRRQLMWNMPSTSTMHPVDQQQQLQAGAESFQAWCSLPLLSPGTLAAMDHRSGL